MKEQDKAALDEAVKQIVQAILVPDRGYKSLDIKFVLSAIGVTDNSANRSLYKRALEAADKKSNKEKVAPAYSSRESMMLALFGKKLKKKKNNKGE